MILYILCCISAFCDNYEPLVYIRCYTYDNHFIMIVVTLSGCDWWAGLLGVGLYYSV